MSTDTNLERSTDENLRQLLGHALVRGGYGSLATEKPPKPLAAIEDWSYGAMLIAWCWSWAAIVVQVGGPVWAAPIAAVAAFALLIGLSELEGPDRRYSVYFLYASLIGSAVWQVFEVQWIALISHAPFALAALAAFVSRRYEPASIRQTAEALRGALKGLPLLFPLIALVIFGLILSDNIWQVAHDEDGWRLVVLGGFVTVPLVTLLAHKLIADLDATFASVAKTVIALDRVDQEVVAHVRDISGDSAAARIDEDARTRMRAKFKAAEPETLVDEVCPMVKGPFRRRITVRLILTVAAVGIVGFAVILLLTWILIREGVAEDWIKPSTVDDHLDLGPFSLPLGPYPRVAAMLAILAGAIFLAFVLTTDEVAKEFRSAYINEPATTVLLLYIPYRNEPKSAPGADAAARATPQRSGDREPASVPGGPKERYSGVT